MRNASEQCSYMQLRRRPKKVLWIKTHNNARKPTVEVALTTSAPMPTLFDFTNPQ